MKLFHGSNIRIKTIDLGLCEPGNDFGAGFYLTNEWRRALEMAKRRAYTNGGNMEVSAFHYFPAKAKAANLKISVFKTFSTSWAKFIILNRTEPDYHHDYDIVIGPVADSLIAKVIAEHKSEYGENYLDEEPLKTFVSKISQFGLDYIQYCFCTQKAVDILTAD